MNNTPQFREECAHRLEALVKRAPVLTAFVGLDGFVDEIIHAVDKRESALKCDFLPTISSFSERIAAASGRSTNIELVTQRTKLGGNGPIMANALAFLGLKVTYVGALGLPRHSVFNDFATRAEAISIAEAGHTDAVEFLDGKVMLVKSVSLNDINWENIEKHFGRAKFVEHFSNASLVSFVNWTMIPFMNEIWKPLLDDACPLLSGPRRKIFFDLADPEKRPAQDIARALELISRFEKYFDVILGLNEKESLEIAEVLGIQHQARTPDALCGMASEIRQKLQIHSLVVHPVTYALAASATDVSLMEGPVITKPVITTGAGDHFNSGFCLGKLLGLDDAQSLLVGVATSGYYVQTGQSPVIQNLVQMMADWPVHSA